MNTNRLILIYKLHQLFNKNELGSVEYELAKFFLDNLKKPEKWNIFYIAEENHVSRASVRRFAKQLGYDNFSDMKKHAQEFDDGIEKYKKFYEKTDFAFSLVKDIEKTLLHLSERFNTQEVDRLIQMMQHKDEIIIICSSNITGQVHTFQQQLIVFNQRVTLVTSKEELARYKQRKSDSLIIVFSVSGLFVSSILLDLKDIYGQKVLFTLDRNPLYNQTFQKIYHLCSQEQKNVNELLYYTYGMSFILDLLLHGFLKEYKKEGIR